MHPSFFKQQCHKQREKTTLQAINQHPQTTQTNIIDDNNNNNNNNRTKV